MTTRDSIHDARYPDPPSTRVVIMYIPRGFHHFDGWHALAYARSRHQDNDYNRMNRQQEVLLAMRQQLDPCTLIPRIAFSGEPGATATPRSSSPATRAPGSGSIC